MLYTAYLHHGHVWEGLEVGRADLAVMLLKQDLSTFLPPPMEA